MSAPLFAAFLRIERDLERQGLSRSEARAAALKAVALYPPAITCAACGCDLSRRTWRSRNGSPFCESCI